MKHRVAISIVIIGFILSGCHNDKATISNEEMADLLYDIHITESATVYNHLSNTSEKSYVYDNILKSHKITPEQFNNYIAWYTQNKGEYKLVYDIVLAKLEKEKKRVLKGEKKCLLLELSSELANDNGGGNSYIQRFRSDPLFWKRRNNQGPVTE